MFKRTLHLVDEHFEEYMLAALLILISCIMLLQIVMRYFFSAALSWPEEISRYCFVYSAFLTVGYCTQRGTLLRVDLVASFLPKAMQRGLDLLMRTVCLLFYAALFYSSILLTQRIHASGQMTPATRIPFSIVYFAAVIGFFCGTIRGAQDLWKHLKLSGKREEAAR